MLVMLQLYKMLHLIGLSLLMGGTFTAFLMSLRRENAFVARHLVAAPGLILMILTGFAQSYSHHWSEFKGAGYRHAKITLVVLTTLFLALDIKQKSALWALLGFLSQLAIMALIVIRPF